jgi:hypothetical protein
VLIYLNTIVWAIYKEQKNLFSYHSGGGEIQDQAAGILHKPFSCTLGRGGRLYPHMVKGRRAKLLHAAESFFYKDLNHIYKGGALLTYSSLRGPTCNTIPSALSLNT